MNDAEFAFTATVTQSDTGESRVDLNRELYNQADTLGRQREATVLPAHKPSWLRIREVRS